MTMLPAVLPFTLTNAVGTLTLVRRNDGQPVAQATVELERTSYQDVPNPIAFPVDASGSPTYVDGWDAPRGTRRHRATDIHATYGTPVYACTGGVVDAWMPGVSHPITVGAGGGYQLRIDHGGERYVYAHLGPDALDSADEAFAPGIEPGATVTAGQLLGWVGESGATASGPHLHLEIRDLAGVVGDDPYADYEATLGTQDAPRYNPYPSLGASVVTETAQETA